MVSDITLAVCVREIRKGLGDEAKTPHYIETVHRRDYRFIAALTTAPSVVSSQASVVSQTEVVSSQHPVARRQEQPANEQEITFL